MTLLQLVFGRQNGVESRGGDVRAALLMRVFTRHWLHATPHTPAPPAGRVVNSFTREEETRFQALAKEPNLFQVG